VFGTRVDHVDYDGVLGQGGIREVRPRADFSATISRVFKKRSGGPIWPWR